MTEGRYEMSALEKNIVYMLMTQLRDNDSPKKKFFTSIQGLKHRLKELDQDIDLTLLLEATGRLVTRGYEFDEPSGDRVPTNLFASVIYIGNGDSIEVEVSRTIRPYLLALKFDFTSYQLRSALSMSSEYSNLH